MQINSYTSAESMIKDLKKISTPSTWKYLVFKKLANNSESLVEVNIFRFYWEKAKEFFTSNSTYSMRRATLNDTGKFISVLLDNNQDLKKSSRLKKTTEIFLTRLNPDSNEVNTLSKQLFSKSIGQDASAKPSTNLVSDPQFTQVIEKTEKFASYMLTPENEKIEPIKLTGVSLRPANLFFQALGLKTTLPGEGLFAFADSHENIKKELLAKDPSQVVEFSAKNIPGETYIRIEKKGIRTREKLEDLSAIYGSNTYKISYGEIQEMLNSQKIYTTSLLPLKFYMAFKEAFLEDVKSLNRATLPDRGVGDDDPVKFSDLDPKYTSLTKFYENVKNDPEKYGFKSSDEFLEFSEQTIYQIGSMVVKTEDYRIFATGKGQILERNVGQKDAIRLINACGIRGVSSPKTPNKFNSDIMRETFKTALAAAESGITLFPAVGMGVWGGNPDLYWPAFFDAIIDSENQLEAICVNPGHRGVWRGGDGNPMVGNEFQIYLDEYKKRYADDPTALSKLEKIVNVFDKKTDLLELARNMKNQYPDKIVSIFNASDPDVTLGFHVTEYMNNLLHADTTEENYGAIGSSGLLFETITGVHEDPARLIET